MFDIDIAKEYGILEAILINNLDYWISHNRANEKNYYDGSYWTYNSTRALQEQFPYASERKIKTALKHLKDEGIIKTGNYNKLSYDRTLWYAFTEKGDKLIKISHDTKSDKCIGQNRHNALYENDQCIVQNEPMEHAKMSNGLCENVQPIPNNITNNKKDNNIYNNIYMGDNSKTKSKNTSKRFIKPSIDEIKEYCSQNDLNIDCERFYDYYESNDWHVGKNKMKDWKATARNWNRNNYSNNNKSASNSPIYTDNNKVYEDDWFNDDLSDL